MGILSHTLTIHKAAGEGKGHIYSSLPLLPAHKHLDINLQVLRLKWLSRTFNRSTCNCHPVNQWDSSTSWTLFFNWTLTEFFDSFLLNLPFLYSLKTSKNQRLKTKDSLTFSGSIEIGHWDKMFFLQELGDTINSFHATSLFLYPLKTENLWFSDVSWGVKKGQWHEMSESA